MLAVGQTVTLAVEKPAAGGRMIARVDGQVVLIAGAIPGERIVCRIDRIGKGVAYGATVEVLTASPFRRTPFTDPLCGGCLYAHIEYPGQLDIKADVIADAFARIGRLPLERRIEVAGSPDSGYRMRARLHARDGRIGSFREGTHEICDIRGTRQLLPETCDVIDRLSATLGPPGFEGIDRLEISENVEASDRAVHFHIVAAAGQHAVKALRTVPIPGVSGLSFSYESSEAETISGSPYLMDVLVVDGVTVRVRRHVLSFFQANRYLLVQLASRVARSIDTGARVVDLYAGVGLFALCAARVRGGRVTAIEGDRVAARDLGDNARQVSDSAQAAEATEFEALHSSVEAYAARSRPSPDIVIVDPPRTGMSREAFEGVSRLGARRLIYVSCDVATLARDCRRLVDAGYRITDVTAFDLFPNTPHVETLVILET